MPQGYRMRIAFVIDGPLDQTSGGYLYDARVIEGLRARGHDVDVISLPQGSTLRRMLTNFDERQLERLAGADVIVEDELSHPGLVGLNPRLRKRTGAPIIALVHHLRSSEPGPRLVRALYAFLETRFLRTVQGFIFNSQATQLTVERLTGVRRPSVIAPPAGDRFPLPLTEEEMRLRAHAPGPLRLLFLGNLIRRKGLITLLKALAALPPSAAELAVVGDSTFEPAHAAAARRRAAQLGLVPRVEWLGPLYDEALAKRLTISQLLVVPSDYEGFGIAYLEGMAFGLPAVGGQAGGASEVIRDGENGFLIPPGDSAALAVILRRLARDRHQLEALSLAAARTFRSHPTWEQTVEIVRRFLTEQTETALSAAHLNLKEETA